MKFIAPEIAVIKFDVADILTTSGDVNDQPVETNPQLETYISLIGMPCTGIASTDLGVQCCI